MTRPLLRWVWGIPLFLTLAAVLTPLQPGISLGQVSGSVRAGAEAEPPDLGLPATFLTYEGTHFRVHSDASASWTRGRMALLERASHQLQRFCRHLGMAYEPPEEKLVCIFFDRYSDYADFARRHDGMSTPWVAGYYAGRANHVVYYNDADAPSVRAADAHLAEARGQLDLIRQRQSEASRDGNREAVEFYAAQRLQLESQLRQEESRLRSAVRQSTDVKAVHEAVHLLAFNTGLQSRYHQYPFWFTEGLATCFETTTPGSAFGPDQDYAPRRERFQELLGNDELLPLTDFVALTDVPDDCADTADVMYHQAYSLLMYLHRYKKRELRQYLESIKVEPPGEIDGARQQALFAASFGPIEALERRWRKHEAKR
ncbi:MAG: DUF1570 domain-containing protein [Phycisphaerales bacterium JB038]